MSEKAKFNYRLSKAAKEFNMGKEAIVKFLAKKGFQIDSAPNTKLTADMYALLVEEFQGEKPMENDIGIALVTEPTNETNEENIVKKEILISLGELHFGTNNISLKKDSLEFVLWETGISHYLNSEKSIKSITAKILLDYSNKSFQFLDITLLSDLKDFSSLLEKVKETEKIQKEIEKFQKQIKKEKKYQPKEKDKTMVEHRVRFSELSFSHKLVSITYKKGLYLYRDSKIQDYGIILSIIYSKLSKTEKNSIKNAFIRVEIDIEEGTFVFKDIDICKYVNNLEEKYLSENNQVKTNNEIPSQNKAEPQKALSASKTMVLGAGNIQFFNGFAKMRLDGKKFLKK